MLDREDYMKQKELNLKKNEIKEYLKSLKKDCMDLVFDKNIELKDYTSKVGGIPYLDELNPYPISNSEYEFVLLAQINFEEQEVFKKFKLFPNKGLLQFFVLNDDLYGMDEDIVVRYIENINKDSNSLNFIPEEIKTKILNNDTLEYLMDFPCGFKCVKSECNISSSIRLKTLLPNEDEELLEEIEKEVYEEDIYNHGGSKIEGWRCFTQMDILENLEDRDDYVLLLQLDVENECGLMFGDCGICNFFIKKEDLKKRDFSKVIYNWDCC